MGRICKKCKVGLANAQASRFEHQKSTKKLTFLEIISFDRAKSEKKYKYKKIRVAKFVKSSFVISIP